MTITRFLPDFVLLSLGIWIAVQGRSIRAKTRNLEALHDDVKRLASLVLDYAAKVDGLECSLASLPRSASPVESSADYARRVGSIEASYCRVRGVDGVLTAYGTILVGDPSAWGTLLASGAGWAQFDTGYYVLTKPAKKDENGIAL